jgi:hypothetical protein
MARVTTDVLADVFLLLHGLFFLHKVDLLKNKFGFDEAFNYKEEPDLTAALKRSVVINIKHHNEAWESYFMQDCYKVCS